ncbi:hypothetical protein Trco_008542 [Trichoderma cornu-damae]|uniref:Uncharacterized protein n=1 Tax=Trichoderma cornu-damae TaxID=654480 RepID=A0A9P8QDM7_9HYPO|nr:hypothetical protein Trco_008542 [Trichoderma cornu-damae]
MPAITLQQLSWTCGIIAIECARTLIAIACFTQGAAASSNALDWALLFQQQEGDEMQNTQVPERQSISFWVHAIDSHLSNDPLPQEEMLPFQLLQAPLQPTMILHLTMTMCLKTTLWPKTMLYHKTYTSY